MDELFVGYGMPKWSPNLNHLAYVDDAITYLSVNNMSLKKIMGILKYYESESGMKVNIEKSFFLHA